MEAQSPDLESIKQISPYQAEYWSARDLAPEPSIKPLLDAKSRKRKKLPSKSNQNETITGTPPQDTLCE
jgi:hypothetical protein